MNFSNKNIQPEELPSVANATFHPLEKGYLVVERISFLITMVILWGVTGALFFFIEALQKPGVVLISTFFLILLSVFFYLSMIMSFKYSGYALREKDVLYRSGWLTRKVRIVMLNRIQHVSIQSGPIERTFGLSSVSIYTAGASEADFTIKGISAQMAQNIKAWISSRLNGAVSQ